MATDDLFVEYFNVFLALPVSNIYRFNFSICVVFSWSEQLILLTWDHVVRIRIISEKENFIHCFLITMTDKPDN